MGTLPASLGERYKTTFTPNRNDLAVEMQACFSETAPDEVVINVFDDLFNGAPANFSYGNAPFISYGDNTTFEEFRTLAAAAAGPNIVPMLNLTRPSNDGFRPELFFFLQPSNGVYYSAPDGQFTDLPNTRFDLGGRTTRPVIPCAWEVPDQTTQTGNGGLTYTPPAGITDICEAIANATECDPIDVTAAPAAEREFIYTVGDFGPFDSFTITARTTTGCEMRAVSPVCTSTLICDNIDNLTVNDAIPGDHAPENFDPQSGDLLCAQSNRSALKQPFHATTLNAEDLAAACIADLASFDDAAPATTGSIDERLAQLGYTGARECLYPARLLTLLGFDGASARGVVEDDRRAMVFRHQLFVGRMLSAWLQVNAFVASEESEGAAVLPGVEGVPSAERLSQTLGQTLGAWDLVFTPRVADQLANLRASALFEDDYHDPFSTGLPSPTDARWTAQESMLIHFAELVEAQADIAEELAADLQPRAKPTARRDHRGVHQAADRRSDAHRSRRARPRSRSTDGAGVGDRV